MSNYARVGDKVNLDFGVVEDEAPDKDLKEHEVSEEASDSDEGQQEFDESSDEVQMMTIPRASKMNSGHRGVFSLTLVRRRNVEGR